MPRIFSLYVLLLLRLEGVSGDLYFLSGKQGWVTFRVTEMESSMNIRGGAPIVFRKSSLAMVFTIYMKIYAKLYICQKLWRPHPWSPTLVHNQYLRWTDVCSSHQKRYRIWWCQRCNPVFARTRARRWRRRRILATIVSSDIKKRLPRNQKNWRRHWPSGRQWRR